VSKPQPARGMRDILPAEAAIRDWVQSRILETYRRFGYTRIETPALENIQLLTGDDGGENAKLVFKVMKRGEKLDLAKPGLSEDELVDLGLRFDLTVPLVRFFTSNRAQLPRVFKAIQIGPVWRAERPQKGRFRQFTQCDIDIIGLEEGLAEAELLVGSAEALIAVGFEGFTIRLNDRRILTAIAKAAGVEEARHGSVFITLDKLDKIGVDGVKKELAQQGFADAQIEALAATLANVEGVSVEDFARRLGASLDAKVVGLVAEILAAVKADAGNRYKVAFDPTLVRGMGYYTGPVFEIASPGYDFSIAGGGRYDRMVGKLSGEEAPACGFSIGFERVVTILMDKAFVPPLQAKLTALLVPDGTGLNRALEAARSLRGQGLAPSLFPLEKKLGRQLDGLQASGFTHYGVLEGDGAPAIKEMKAVQK
jgi:histidyl-tRNA synthetase